ncbi:NRDE family protein [Chondromyces apiculatus]|uniref:NRDE family protein n=1 Tax=Chondromyces apiculatus DSM 436 TaxID=1192034 RepID=A0A017TD72_9BACT|nr:NRDE family protein [Chondromyces apiculatus]EYF06872.1 Hypothetical protein CAP_1569 [Chondromyces apiculatus DSM 436]
MCTLIAAVGQWPSFPLVVAANRDEFLARPARPPFLWPGEPRLVAPRDEVAGGSWLGLNAHGLFVGITNRAGAPPDPSRRSRGALVMDALRAPSAVAVRRMLADLGAAAHNPFHLFYADRETAYLTWSDGEAVQHEALAPGVYVVSERSFGAGELGREAAIRARWASEVAGKPLHLDQLRALLIEHGEHDARAGTCVHLDDLGYGSRSSLLLALGETWDTTAMRWGEGRPCQVPFVDRGELIAALGEG